MIDVKTTQYDGDVVGLTVPNHILRVRRNGKECWTGNSGRNVGGYTMDHQPAKGGSTGSKRLGGFDINALLAHGATDVIKDAQLIRGTRNEDYWNALRMGRPLQEPGVPFIYDKFMAMLKAGGINTQRKGDIISIMPLTNTDVEGISAGEIKTSDLLDSRKLEPIPGGLFDRKVTGGLTGNRWGHVTLTDKMPNPVMEEPIRRILGLTQKRMRNIISGREELNGLTGGQAIEKALLDLDVDKMITKYKGDAKTLRGANRDSAVKALRYLTAAKKQDIKPSDWLINKVPILPPTFRPVSQMGDIMLVPDINELYRDLIEVNNGIKTMRKDLPESALADDKENLYDAVKAAYGVGDPITAEGRSKRLKGAIRQVIGNNPKRGLFQSKLISKTVDVVGRGVIAPDPDLDMDSIGIPEDKAWTLYKPFVIRKLVRRGIPAARAAEMVENRSKEARSMLDDEVKARPVIANRAPTWHKFNLLAFYPKIVDEDVIRVSPLIVAGFNADFDGDQMNFHVPASDKAVQEAQEKMLPSKNLFAVKDLKSPQHTPSKEMVMGLYQMTKAPTKKPPKVFHNIKEAREAYNQGLIGMNDPIVIQN